MLKLKILLFIYSLIILVSRCKAINYCNADICNGSKQHTLCKFQSLEPADHCIDFEMTIKTPEDKIAILDKINSRRDKVASGDIKSLPSADNMLKLEWNVELETSAQRWANQCVKHNVPDVKDTCRDLENVYVGQNIATVHGDAPGLTPIVLVDVWYMELMHTNASILSKYGPSKTDNSLKYDYFTQLVWAESSQVGCGAIKFKERYEDVSEFRNRTIYRLVCNFASSGNQRDKSVYNSGLPCSRCPSGYSCDSVYKSLCSFNGKVKEIYTEIINSVNTFQRSNLSNIAEYGHIVSTSYSITSKEGSKDIEKYDNITISDLELEKHTFTPFDYFSHLHEFTSSTIADITEKPHTCKDVLAVEEFIDLLKKKLSSDAMFKEVFRTSSYNDHSETVTDPSVVAFISHIYSTKTPLTTKKVTENDIVNSTLLVDLVEAVIFRSADKTPAFYDMLRFTPSIVEVSPVKIQAELAEVKQNQDFTGHYFFPEEDEETSSQTTESYYDTPDIAISDVVLEIEEIKRTTTSKDFLYEILESDEVTDNTMSASGLLLLDDSTQYKTKHDYVKDFLKNVGENQG